LQVDGAEEKHIIKFDIEANKPIDCNRNSMVKKFLGTDCEWFLTIDADNPPIGNPLKRLKLDKDILAFPTPIWYSQITRRAQGESPIVWNCFDRAADGNGWREHYPQGGLQEIDAAGTGCMLIKRKVLEHPDMKPAFYREWNEHGIVTGGSDLVFCKRAKAAGFEIWADYGCACHHFKEIDLTQIYELFKMRDITAINSPNINTQEYWNERWRERIGKEQDRLGKGDDNEPSAIPILPVYDYVVDRVKQGIAEKGKDSPYRILDYGCGAGALLDKLAEIDNVELFGQDISDTAIEYIKGKGYAGSVENEPCGVFDCVVSTELLEHVDNNEEMLSKMCECADRVIYTVPNNCMPPGLEREHRRVYTPGYCERITPHVQEISVIHQYLLVVADKNLGDTYDGRLKQIVDVCERD
jgi:SAM-dependent methyltransferase